MSRYSWKRWTDPAHPKQNPPRERIDAAIEAARNPTNGDCSIATRKKNYETFNKILNDNQPYNFGYVPNVLYVSQKSLQNFNPAPFAQVYNIYEWWIKQ